MKYLIALSALVLAGCGGGSEPEAQPQTMSVRLSANTKLPEPFVIGGSAPEVAVGPTVSFVAGPVVGPVAIVTTPVISTAPNTPEPNWCTDGFVIGPCVPRCQANQFSIGPC
jgi:hypothetical protein